MIKEAEDSENWVEYERLLNSLPNVDKHDFVGRYRELEQQMTTIENEAQVTPQIAWEIKRTMKGEFGIDSAMYNACFKRWIYD